MKAQSVKECYYCSTKQTSLWRKFEGFTCCNACGLYMRSNKAPRPEWLKKRVTDRKSTKEEKRCVNCKATESVLWRRDPEGGMNCNRCGIYQRIHGRPRPLDLEAKMNRRQVLASLGPIKTLSGSVSDSGVEFPLNPENSVEMQLQPNDSRHKRTKSLDVAIPMVKHEKVQKKQLPPIKSLMSGTQKQRVVLSPIYSPTQLKTPNVVSFQLKPSKFPQHPPSLRIPQGSFPSLAPKGALPITPMTGSPKTNLTPTKISPVSKKLAPSKSPLPAKGLEWLVIAADESAKLPTPIESPQLLKTPKQSLMSVSTICS